MTNEEIAWLAGILEGEGCFDLNNKKAGLFPRIRLEMTDEDIVNRVQKLIGGYVTSRPPRKSHHKHQYTLRVCKREWVEPTLKAILPWLGKRRQEKVLELLKSYK